MDADGGMAGSSYSLDTCDQVRKKELSFSVKVNVETLYRYRKSHEVAKEALVEALRACGREAEADAVAACGEDFKVGKCLDCGAAPAFPITCDHRLCPDCAARRAAILIDEHSDILKQIRYPKVLMLTFPSVAHLDKAYIKWARNCFTRLRRRKVFRSCWGGIYSFEATYTEGVGWHLHIHALIASGYIKQADLSREWEKITGCRIVWIEAVKGKDKWDAVKEVVKYPAKTATFLDKPQLVNEFLLATEGVNLAYGFGALYRVKTRRHSGDRMRCPVCGGSDISWADGFGFCVPGIAVERVRGGYLWRPPPGT
jgi:Zn finger protein HypA/HybF involved in hydrogenase expression